MAKLIYQRMTDGRYIVSIRNPTQQLGTVMRVEDGWLAKSLDGSVNFIRSRRGDAGEMLLSCKPRPRAVT